MPFLTDNALDALLNYVRNNAEELHICTTLPTTYTEATSTYSLGQKTSPSIAAPTNRSGGGRECVVSAISDGVSDGNGTAGFWAIVKASATSELLAAGALGATQVITSGNPFTLTQFTVGVPDAV